MSKIFNEAAIISLCEINGENSKKFVSKLIEEFQISSIPMIREIERSAQENDFEKLEFLSHILKSSALTLGLDLLGETCRELESFAAKKANTLELVKNFEDLFAKSLKELKAYTQDF